MAQRTIKLDSVMAYLCDASLTTVRFEMPKYQIDSVFIPSGKIIARLTELKIAYYLLLIIIFLAHDLEYASSFINQWKFVATSMKKRKFMIKRLNSLSQNLTIAFLCAVILTENSPYAALNKNTYKIYIHVYFNIQQHDNKNGRPAINL